jgi:DNA-binding LacI/PurR family transcriptional regulator
MGVTISDVARHAGVSASTVSYVLTGKRPISPSTRTRVQESIAELGYSPHAMARALVSKRSRAIAVVAPLRSDNNVPVMMQFVASFATAARERQHDVLLVTEASGDDAVRRLGGTSLVDAVIVMDVQMQDPRAATLARLKVPCILIGHPEDSRGLSCLGLDMRRAGVMSVEYLHSLGHQSVALVGSPAAVYERGSAYAVRYGAGFEAAAERLDMEHVWTPVEQTYDATERALVQVFTDQPDTTCLVVHNEAILGEVLAVLHAMHRRVPEDISVVALCPPELAMSQRVPLTNIDVPTDLIGRKAVEMALALVENDAPEVRMLAPQLFVRDSTAPPRIRRKQATRPA